MLPDLSGWTPHRTVLDAPFEGEPVPGLRADYFRRPEGDRVATAGRYAMAGRELLMAWGYVDEEHCRHHAVRAADGGWHEAVDGCPEVELMRDGQAVAGLAVRTPEGEWIRVAPGRSPSPGPDGARLAAKRRSG
ncbi:hypothetical protein [Actinoplanes solisilvae]|uniref:hypothetical protein n=1 Tax=Actinoplanes solisilvae TaxID=2486853 RepID=UPI000FD8A423|nr:hypothetical protein [Actinoplanes solisilvae]